MSRWVYLLGVGVALVAEGFLVTDALLWERGVTETNTKHLRQGMNFGEVVAILGAHPLGDQANPGKKFVLLVWPGKEGSAAVLFAKGQVLNLAWRRTNFNSHLLARLRAWLGW
jgi:hypothetical protein